MDPISIGEEFMRMTRYAFAVPSDQKLGAPAPPLHRRHPLAGTAVPLPSPLEHTVDLLKLINTRESVRHYAKMPLSLADLSWLLWATQGVKKGHESGIHTLRTVPSAGARHPFETYLAVNQVETLESGLYQYLPFEHALAPVPVEEGLSPRLAAACLDQSMLQTCAVTFIWTAVPYRTTWRYGQRGYRYMHLDAGHVCQNLYLGAEAIGAGCCAIAAFEDDNVAEVLHLDPAQEFVIYLATVGMKRAAST